MLQAYNYYLGGFLPKVSARYSVHKKKELKNIYQNIVNLNKQSPLVMVELSDAKQEYALDVKEMSLEMEAMSSEALDSFTSPEERAEAWGETVKIFNRMLKRSDEFGEENGKPSRPGGELRRIVKEFQSELQETGVEIGEGAFLKIPDGGTEPPENFLQALKSKSRHMSINPMEYVDKKICSYAFLANKNMGASYEASVYSGMLFNSYC